MTTMIEYQIMMQYQLIIKQFGPNIQHISGVDNIVADMLIITPYVKNDQVKTNTINFQCCNNKIFTTSVLQEQEYGLPLYL